MTTRLLIKLCFTQPQGVKQLHDLPEQGPAVVLELCRCVVLPCRLGGGGIGGSSRRVAEWGQMVGAPVTTAKFSSRMNHAPRSTWATRSIDTTGLYPHACHKLSKTSDHLGVGGASEVGAVDGGRLSTKLRCKQLPSPLCRGKHKCEQEG